MAEATLMFCGKCGTPLEGPTGNHAPFCDALRLSNLFALADPVKRAALVDRFGDEQVMVMAAILGNGRTWCKGCQYKVGHPHAGIYAEPCQHGELMPHWVE